MRNQLKLGDTYNSKTYDWEINYGYKVRTHELIKLCPKACRLLPIVRS
jgi:hypothetical protein